MANKRIRKKQQQGNNAIERKFSSFLNKLNQDDKKDILKDKNLTNNYKTLINRGGYKTASGLNRVVSGIQNDGARIYINKQVDSNKNLRTTSTLKGGESKVGYVNISRSDLTKIKQENLNAYRETRKQVNPYTSTKIDFKIYNVKNDGERRETIGMNAELRTLRKNEYEIVRGKEGYVDTNEMTKKEVNKINRLIKKGDWKKAQKEMELAANRISRKEEMNYEFKNNANLKALSTT